MPTRHAGSFRNYLATLQPAANTHLVGGIELERPTWRCRDRLSCPMGWIAPSNRRNPIALAFMALPRRWRSRPQHQVRTLKCVRARRERGAARSSNYVDAAGRPAMPRGRMPGSHDGLFSDCPNYARRLSDPIRVVELTGDRHRACTASEIAAPRAFSSEHGKGTASRSLCIANHATISRTPRAALAASTSRYIRRPLWPREIKASRSWRYRTFTFLT